MLDGREDELPAPLVGFTGPGLKLQRVEQPVFDVREMAPDDARRRVVVQPRAQPEQPKSRQEEVPNGNRGHRGEEEVEEARPHVSAEPAHRLEADHDEPRDGQGGGEDEGAAQHFVAVVLPHEGIQSALEFLVLSGHSGRQLTAQPPRGSRTLKIRPDRLAEFITC